MNKKEEMQKIAFEIISNVGMAKSLYLESLSFAKKNDFTKADELFKEAQETYNKGHAIHFQLIQEEANGIDLPFSLVLMHAEDQLLNTQTIEILVKELIDIYRKESLC